MSQAQAIDYDALAAQHGGSTAPPPVDYDALAKQHGGSSSTASAAPTTPKQDWLDRLVQWLPMIGGTVGGLAGATVGPPGAVMGAAFGGAAGEAYKELMNRARGHVAAPTSMTDAGLQMAKQGAIQGGAEVAGQAVVGPAMSWMGKRLMQSAAKPSLRILNKTAPGTTPRVVQTLLDEGVNVTPGGVQKLEALLSTTKQDVADTIAQAGSKTIEPLRVASRLTPTARRFATQVNPQTDMEAVSQVGQNFLEANPSPLSLETAQALKQGTYARIGGKYGKEGAATIEAEKALARGLKEELEHAAPGIADLNAQESKLLEALHVVGKRVALSGNRDPIGLAWVAHNPKVFLAAVMDRSPAVKSFLARGMYSQAGRAASVSPILVRVATHAIVSGDPDAALAPATSGGQ